MIEIKDIQGNILASVPITQSCQKVEELMVNDYIQLSWNSDTRETLPVGSYIEYNGERYSLIEPYSPSQKNETEFVYTPQFKSRVMAWSKKPFFFYSGESKEPDWTLTSNPADFMRCVCDAISNETGETWSYSIDASLPASASLSFSSSDILSGLNQIAGAFETEWFADKSTNTLYLGLLSHGEEVTLKVGENINVPSVQGNKEGYYTRFYAFGSTRNIAQDYEGSNTNNLVNKRLTLDPIKYPNGYKDIREGLSEGEIFSKVLIFDEVYPSANLSISGVRNRLMYRLDSDGKKIQLGTDESGNPIYDQYAIWYFRIEGFDFDVSNIIEGYKLSVSFQSGSLQGREFELKYYEKDTTITTSDGVVFEAKAGDYEILFVEEGSYIIPSMTGLVPTDGDSVVLFNIKMPSEYTQSAYDKLEEELDKAISRINSDLNNYTFKSNPVAFNDNNPNLSIGRNVKYVNGSYSFNTRVIKLITHLDFPIEQEITIGNEKVKGNTQQLKEEVASANKDLNLLAVFNDMTQSLQQSYNRTQQMMLDGFAAIKNIWQLKTDSNGKTYAFSAFDVVTQYGITMYADGEDLDLPSIYAGLPIDTSTLRWIETTDSDGTVTRLLGINPDIDLGGGAATWDELEGKPSWIGNTKPSYNYSEILQTPDLSVYALASDLEKYVTLGGDETITGLKNFTKGIQIDGLGITKSQDDVIYLDANLVVRGGITMYAEGTVDVGTIFDALPIDDSTIYWEGGVLKANITEGVITNITSAMVVEALGYTPYNASNPNGYISGITSDMVTTALGYTPLKDHQTIYALTIQKNGTTIDTYTPNSAKKTINIVVPTKVSELTNDSEYATTSDLDTRISDLINGAPAAYDTLKEIAEVLEGNINSIGDIITTLGTKADKATKISAGTGLSGGGTLEADRTLSLATSGVSAGTYKSVTVDKYGRVTSGTNPTTLAGYGITDAYTKTNVDDLLKLYVTLATAQTITGEKDFTGGLKVNGSPIVYDSTNKYWKLEGDLLVTGGVTMYGSDSEFKPSTIMDGVTVDNVTIKKNAEGALYFAGSVDGGVASSVDWENITSKPTFATVATSGKYSDLTGLPDLTVYAKATDLSSYQTKITSTNKLAYSLISGTPTSLKNPNALSIKNSSGTEQVSYDGSEVKSLTLTKAMVGLGNVENTALSSWAGTSKITTLGTISSGTWNGTKIANDYLANSSLTISGTSVSLGGSITQAALRTALGLGSNAYTSTEYLPASSYTASDILTKLKTVDGAGSGLDADTLDGLQPSELNVGSASKLQTARTIWGQSFDGTGNVSGALSGATTGAFSSNVTIGGTLGITGAATLKSTLSVASDTTLATKLTLNGIPIYKSQDDVLYIDGNLAVRGGITMYATDAIDVDDIIANLPIASTSEKGIASFNPNDFSVVDGYVSFIGSGGVDESVLADYAKKTDLSAYLPLSGGQMTGGISCPIEYDGNITGLAASCVFYYDNSLTARGSIDNKRSLMGCGKNNTTGYWYNIISVRGDSSNYGMYITSSMNLNSQDNLSWNRQIGSSGDWQGERVILDSVNWSQYVTAADGGSYLPLSGGTLSGLLGIDFLNSTDNISSAVGLHVLRSAAASDEWGAGIALTAYQGKGSVIMSGGYGGAITYYNGYSYLDRASLRWDNEGNLFVPNVMFEKGGSVAEQYKCGMYMWDNILQITKRQLDLTYIKEMLTIDLPNERIKCHVITEFTDYIQTDGRYAYIASSSFNSVAASGGWAVGHILRKADRSFIGYSCGGFGMGDNLIYYFYGGDYDAHAMRLIGNDMLVTGGITMYSDIRKKTKLQDVELSLKQIADAPLIEHYYNGDDKRTTHVGSIAQYWAGLNDWFCKLDNEGYYTMEIQNAALASAISIARHLQKYETKTDRTIRKLKQRVSELEEKIEELEKKGA